MVNTKTYFQYACILNILQSLNYKVVIILRSYTVLTRCKCQELKCSRFGSSVSFVPSCDGHTIQSELGKVVKTQPRVFSIHNDFILSVIAHLLFHGGKP